MRYALRCQILQSGPGKADGDEPAVIQSPDAEVSAAVETRAQRVEQDKPLSKSKVVDSPFSELSAQSFLQEQSKDKSLEVCFLQAQKPNEGEGKKSLWKGVYCIDCMSEKERRGLS